MRCLNGEIQARLVLTKPADRERLKKMGIDDLDRVYRTEDLAPGKNVIFAACRRHRRRAPARACASSATGRGPTRLVMTTVPHQVRFIDTIHAKDDPDVKIRF